MSQDYRNNHYVPKWYQRRFIPPGKPTQELYHRDLNPPVFRDAEGRPHAARAVSHRGTNKSFVDRDLYTRYLGRQALTDLENIFFGRIDRRGKEAVDGCSTFSPATFSHQSFRNLLSFMGSQKLRTPKGLGWVADQAGTTNRDAILRLMAQNHRMYSAIWSEGVWQIADASQSETKFIVSDHPVTLYNRRCGPKSSWCRGFSDPDVLFHGTHTLFPLSLEKMLILEINFIIRSRALRYIAGGERDWLFPEDHVSKSDWSSFGGGYLLMPDPRPLSAGKTLYAVFNDGRSHAADDYGRKPNDSSFEAGREPERAALDRFKGEFARLYGPERRGRSREWGPELSPERDSEDTHEYFLGLEESGRNDMKRIISRG